MIHEFNVHLIWSIAPQNHHHVVGAAITRSDGMKSRDLLGYPIVMPASDPMEATSIQD